jgi:uncharacterized OB-fold protein
MNFIEKANIKHNNKYDYSLVNYINSKTKIEIICPEHGSFMKTPHSHLCGQGCPKCSNHFTPTTEEWIEKAIKVHNNKYDYSKVVYISSDTKVKIICKIHGVFMQTPEKHLSGNGCQKCGKVYRPTTDEFINEANKIHNNKYYYYKVNYINAKTKVEIICHNHGSFMQTPDSHVRGSGCPRCSKIGFSQKAINWLESIMTKENIYIEHAMNAGEYRIPNTRFRADGYCKDNNTVYEFHGTIYHGDKIMQYYINYVM